MKKFTATTINADTVEEAGFKAFAEMGLVASDYNSELNEWQSVESSYVKFNGETGYFTSSYCESEGFVNFWFNKVYPVPAWEIKRGPMPKDQVVIDGVRFYK